MRVEKKEPTKSLGVTVVLLLLLLLLLSLTIAVQHADNVLLRHRLKSSVAMPGNAEVVSVKVFDWQGIEIPAASIKTPGKFAMVIVFCNPGHPGQ